MKHRHLNFERRIGRDFRPYEVQIARNSCPNMGCPQTGMGFPLSETRRVNAYLLLLERLAAGRIRQSRSRARVSYTEYLRRRSLSNSNESRGRGREGGAAETTRNRSYSPPSPALGPSPQMGPPPHMRRSRSWSRIGVVEHRRAASPEHNCLVHVMNGIHMPTQSARFSI